MWIEILGLIISIAVLIVLAYRGVQALPLAIVAGLVVVITNGMDIWDSFAAKYMGGYVGFIQSYFLIFAASSLYAKLMDVTGSAVAIGQKFIQWFGAKRALLVVVITSGVLTYGGVSTFVIIFAMAPITYTLFKSADIPRRHIPAVIGIGACTFTMTALPGSVQIQNIVPTQYLGTSMTAAPVLGIIASVMMFAMGYAYMAWAVKRSQAKGEHFDLPPEWTPPAMIWTPASCQTLWRPSCPWSCSSL